MTHEAPCSVWRRQGAARRRAGDGRRHPDPALRDQLIHAHPHIHALVTEGVLLPDLSACGHAQAGGTFVPLPKLATGPFLRLRESRKAGLLAEGRITEAVVANIRSWRHSGFSVDQSVRWEAADQQSENPVGIV